jgi:hypothetical protein
MQRAAPHFVRCIKPNPDRRALCFDQPFVLRQLNYAGVLETIRIRQEGFPIRLRYQRFVEEFSVVAFDWCQQGQVPTTATMARKILEKTGDADWLLGRTKIFLKERHRKALLNLKTRFFHLASEAQRFARGYLGRRIYRGMLQEQTESTATVAAFFSEVERHHVAKRVEHTVQEGAERLLAEAGRKMNIAAQLASMAVKRLQQRAGIGGSEDDDLGLPKAGDTGAPGRPPPPPVAPKPKFLQQGQKRGSNDELIPMPPPKRLSLEALHTAETDASQGHGPCEPPAHAGTTAGRLPQKRRGNNDGDNDGDDDVDADASDAMVINKVIYRLLIKSGRSDGSRSQSTSRRASDANLMQRSSAPDRPSQISGGSLEETAEVASRRISELSGDGGDGGDGRAPRRSLMKSLRRRFSGKAKGSGRSSAAVIAAAAAAEQANNGVVTRGDVSWKETPKMKRSLSSFGRMAAQMTSGDDGAGRAESFLDFLDAFSNEVSQMAPCFRPGCEELFFSMRELEKHLQACHVRPEPVMGQDSSHSPSRRNTAESVARGRAAAATAAATARDASPHSSPPVPPKSYTEDMTWLDDKAQALSCVYWEHAVAVAQFAVATQESVHVMCARAGKVASRAAPGSALLDLAELDNPFRRSRTERVRRYIGSGVEISVRQRSLYLMRHSRNAVYVKHWAQRAERFCLPLREGANEGTVHDEISPQGELPLNKEVCVFDFQVFRKQLINLSAGEAMLRATVSVALVRDSTERADTPAWLTVRMCDALRLWERHHHSGPMALY